MKLHISEKTEVNAIEFTYAGKVVCSIQIFSDGALYVDKALRVNIREDVIKSMKIENHYQRIYFKE